MGLTLMEVMAMTTPDDEQREPWPPEDDLSFDELAKRQGVRPVASLAELAQPDLWESDEEYDAFLADLYTSRRVGMRDSGRPGHRRRLGAADGAAARSAGCPAAR